MSNFQGNIDLKIADINDVWKVPVKNNLFPDALKRGQ